MMNKRFLVIAVLLIVVTMAGLLTIIMIATIPIDGDGMYHDDVTYISTNAFVATAISSTATAKAWTATPPLSSR